jgi:hypothetical protein
MQNGERLNVEQIRAFLEASDEARCEATNRDAEENQQQCCGS